jgi:hypothetical protein
MRTTQGKVKRFTVGFEPPAMAAIERVMEVTHYKSLPDVVRASVSTFVDLLDAEDRNMEVILRDEAGNEWRYSPHKPGRATPLLQASSGEEGVVVRPTFGRSPADALRFGSATSAPISDETTAQKADRSVKASAVGHARSRPHGPR